MSAWLLGLLRRHRLRRAQRDPIFGAALALAAVRVAQANRRPQS